MCKGDLHTKDLWGQMHQLSYQASVPQTHMQTCTHTCALMGLVHTCMSACEHLQYTLAHTQKLTHTQTDTHTLPGPQRGFWGHWVLTPGWSFPDSQPWSRSAQTATPSSAGPAGTAPWGCIPASVALVGGLLLAVGKKVTACHFTLLSAICHWLDKYLVTIHKFFLCREATHIAPAPQVSKLKSLFCTWPLGSPEGVRAFALCSSTLWTPQETDYSIHS